MGLKLNRAVSYPMRGELLAFGRNVCRVNDPTAVVDRITDAMSATLAEEGERMPPRFVAALRVEWDAGRSSVLPMQVSGRQVEKEGAMGSGGAAAHPDAG